MPAERDSLQRKAVQWCHNEEQAAERQEVQECRIPEYEDGKVILTDVP